MRKLLMMIIAALGMLNQTAARTFEFGTNVNPQGVTFEVDSVGFIIGGKRVVPVMGEIHYSRVDKKDWARELRKMKAGGITVIATYCFWNHHEWEEGKWDWTEKKDLRGFLEACQKEEMPVVLRIGPFCHGEVFQGGMPNWIVNKAQEDKKNYKVRSLAPGFMKAAERLYRNIFAQVGGMLWKDGGPVVGVQIENECRGPWQYYQELKAMAVKSGFDVPFYTRTGWPKLNGREVFGELLPLYGDYADGFWDRELTDMPGDYSNAFIMKDSRLSSVIATETFGNNQDTRMEVSELKYPYLTCELGGGMMPSYHRRINITGREALPLAICKVGSGSNLPGYYMYHGGTNPMLFETLENGSQVQRTMAETQKSVVTNYNDMPFMSYDFQCQLGEMGQPNWNSYHETRLFHQFLADWGEELAPLRSEIISKNLACRGAFEFFCDYVRMKNEDGKAWVRPVGMSAFGKKITADAQPFCMVSDTLYFVEIEGKKPVIEVDGKRLTAKKDKLQKINGLNVVVLSREKAFSAYKIDGAMKFAQHRGGIVYKAGNQLVEEFWTESSDVKIKASKRQEAGDARIIKMGSQKVAAMPENEDFDLAEVWALELEFESGPSIKQGELMTMDLRRPAMDNAEDYFVEIEYEGDCARVYADGKIVEDNFWNGKSMLVRLSDLVGKKVELRILPLGKDAPIYLQKEQRAILAASQNQSLLKLKSIRTIKRTTETIQ